MYIYIYFVRYIVKEINSGEIEHFVEVDICKLCALCLTLPSRLLRVLDGLMQVCKQSTTY